VRAAARLEDPELRACGGEPPSLPHCSYDGKSRATINWAAADLGEVSADVANCWETHRTWSVRHHRQHRVLLRLRPTGPEHHGAAAGRRAYRARADGAG